MAKYRGLSRLNNLLRENQGLARHYLWDINPMLTERIQCGCTWGAVLTCWMVL